MRKITNGLKFAAAALVLGVASHAAMAAPASLDQVPAGSDWMVHIDFEQFRNTAVGQRVGERLDNNPKAAAGRAYVQTAVGIDLREDLLDMTLFGKGADQDDAVMLVGVRADLTQFLESERNRAGSDFRTSEFGQHMIYSSVEPRKNERRYMAIVPRETGHTAIIGRSATTVRNTLDVVDGKAGNAAAGELGQLVTAAPGPYFQFAAVHLASLVEGKPRSAMFQHIRRTVVQSGESDGQAFLSVTVTTADEATAGNMYQAMEGLLAMGRLRAQQMPGLEVLLDAVSIQQQQATLDMDIRLPADQFVELLERHAARHGH